MHHLYLYSGFHREMIILIPCTGCWTRISGFTSLKDNGQHSLLKDIMIFDINNLLIYPDLDMDGCKKIADDILGIDKKKTLQSIWNIIFTHESQDVTL